MADERSVKMTVNVGGKAVRLGPQYSIEFDTDENGEPIPKLTYRCLRVKQAVTIRMQAYLPAEGK